MQTQKHVMQVEPPEPEVPIRPKVPDEPLAQIGHPPNPKDPILKESREPEPFE